MKIASQIENITVIHALLRSLKQQDQLDEELYNRIFVSVNESLTNAIQHGNKHDPSKYVYFEHQKSSDGTYLFSIRDEGEGFDWQLEDNGLPAEHEERGRGLPIIRRLSDRYCFNKKGNRIEIYFTIEHTANSFF